MVGERDPAGDTWCIAGGKRSPGYAGRFPGVWAMASAAFSRSPRSRDRGTSRKRANLRPGGGDPSRPAAGSSRPQECRACLSALRIAVGGAAHPSAPNAGEPAHLDGFRQLHGPGGWHRHAILVARARWNLALGEQGLCSGGRGRQHRSGGSRRHRDPGFPGARGDHPPSCREGAVRPAARHSGGRGPSHFPGNRLLRRQRLDRHRLGYDRARIDA